MKKISFTSNVINKNESTKKAQLLLKEKQILFIVDDVNKFLGVLTKGDIKNMNLSASNKKVSSICNRNCKYIIKRSKEDYLHEANSIFRTFPSVNILPILDLSNNLIECLSRDSLFSSFINYKTFNDLSIDISHNLYKFDSDIDLIVGIPRSGMYPSLILSSYFNIPVATLNEFIGGIIPSIGYTRPGKKKIVSFSQIKRIAVIDDSILSGNAMRKAKEALSEVINCNNIKATFYAVYYDSLNKPDYLEQYVDVVFQECPIPRAFQWNILTHPGILSNACIDIDGVVCEDPSDEENDDGNNYIEFLNNAKPRLSIPTNVRISCFVTSRLEKYRVYTEKWLKKYFNYGSLIMLDLPSKEERIRLKAHASFKSKVFSDRQEFYFIESNLNQAIEIKNKTGKLVFCTESMMFV